MVTFSMAAKMNALGIFRTGDLPYIPVIQPVVRFFNLITILDQLPEHTVFVADTVTGDRQLQGCTAIDKAGSQTAQTTITQACIPLHLYLFFIAQTQLMQGIGCFFVQPQIEYGIAQCTSHQEFK